jgi:hypothetical protein
MGRDRQDMNLPERFIHQTTRYVMGRTTYAVHEHCDWLVAHWDRIPEAERRVIQQDLEEAFGRDDRAREMGSKDCLWLGHDCDRNDWERVRALYAAQSAGKQKGG